MDSFQREVLDRLAKLETRLAVVNLLLLGIGGGLSAIMLKGCM